MHQNNRWRPGRIDHLESRIQHVEEWIGKVPGQQHLQAVEEAREASRAEVDSAMQKMNNVIRLNGEQLVSFRAQVEERASSLEARATSLQEQTIELSQKADLFKKHIFEILEAQEQFEDVEKNIQDFFEEKCKGFDELLERVESAAPMSEHQKLCRFAESIDRRVKDLHMNMVAGRHALSVGAQPPLQQDRGSHKAASSPRGKHSSRHSRGRAPSPHRDARRPAPDVEALQRKFECLQAELFNFARHMHLSCEPDRDTDQEMCQGAAALLRGNPRHRSASGSRHSRLHSRSGSVDTKLSRSSSAGSRLNADAANFVPRLLQRGTPLAQATQRQADQHSLLQRLMASSLPAVAQLDVAQLDAPAGTDVAQLDVAQLDAAQLDAQPAPAGADVAQLDVAQPDAAQPHAQPAPAGADVAQTYQ